jgi:hypothetical protein
MFFQPLVLRAGVSGPRLASGDSLKTTLENIDPVNALVKQQVGHWGEAILHLGARRPESSTHAQTIAAR